MDFQCSPFAHRIHFFMGLGFEIQLIFSAFEQSGKIRSDGRLVRTELGSFTNHSEVHVHDLVPRALDSLDRFLQEGF